MRQGVAETFSSVIQIKLFEVVLLLEILFSPRGPSISRPGYIPPAGLPPVSPLHIRGKSVSKSGGQFREKNSGTKKQNNRQIRFLILAMKFIIKTS
jgi:hypothetical protein